MAAMLMGQLGNVDEDAARTFGPPPRHEPREDAANLADVADHEAGEGELDEGAAADAEEAGKTARAPYLNRRAVLDSMSSVGLTPAVKRRGSGASR
eukprot:1226938-Pyramimonas_sp.AAC.1